MSHPLVRQRARARRRNTAVALIFALGLCVAGVVLAVDTLSDAVDGDPALTPAAPLPSQPVADPPATSAPPAAGAQTSSPAAPVESTAFVSPSGNIGCTISARAARCDIVDKAWDPGAKPESCTGTWGAGVMVDEAGPSVVCATDSAVGAGPILGYGKTITEGDYVCSSSEAGMRCENSRTGQGFSLSRRAYTFF